jgi:lactoylglutathione lyase
VPELIHTCFWVGDIPRSIDFYKLLGFEVWVRDTFKGNPYAFLGFAGDGPRIELNYEPGVDSYDVGNGYRHIAVTVDDMSATLAGLAKAGYEPNNGPFALEEVPGTTVCYIKDPDGYEIEVWSPHGPEFPPPTGN